MCYAVAVLQGLGLGDTAALVCHQAREYARKVDVKELALAFSNKGTLIVLTADRYAVIGLGGGQGWLLESTWVSSPRAKLLTGFCLGMLWVMLVCLSPMKVAVDGQSSS